MVTIEFNPFRHACNPIVPVVVKDVEQYFIIIFMSESYGK